MVFEVFEEGFLGRVEWLGGDSLGETTQGDSERDSGQSPTSLS
jgi:hypothetical protein